MEPTGLQITWFLLFGFLIAGFAVLDGFDLGVGILSLFTKKPDDRRLMINAIGPVWDGNEVWLITAGAGLFAAFPPVYATVFSGFYLAIMLLLTFLIMRAVSIEFRGQVASPRWSRFWDVMFGVGSLGAAFLFGVAVGNLMRGVPINEQGVFTGSFLGLLSPYALLIGALSVVMMTAHGGIYMAKKSEGELHERMLSYATRAWTAWVALYVVATIYTFFEAPHLLDGTLDNPLTWVAMLALLGALAFIPFALRSGRLGRGFFASAAAICAMWALVGLGLFPDMVPSSIDSAYNITAANGSSTERTLMTMLVIVGLGMPFVLGYTIWVYWIFKGKTVVGHDSY